MDFYYSSIVSIWLARALKSETTAAREPSEEKTFSISHKPRRLVRVKRTDCTLPKPKLIANAHCGQQMDGDSSSGALDIGRADRHAQLHGTL